jgi:hypothetical protein
VENVSRDFGIRRLNAVEHSHLQRPRKRVVELKNVTANLATNSAPGICQGSRPQHLEKATGRAFSARHQGRGRSPNHTTSTARTVTTFRPTPWSYPRSYYTPPRGPGPH